MKIRSLKLRNSFFLSLGPIFIVVLLIVMGRQFVVSMQDFDSIFEKSSEHLSLAEEMLLLDRDLTNSARLAVLTGEKKWIAKYKISVKELDNKIQEVYKFIERNAQVNSITLTEKSNALLVEMEERALDLTREGKKKEAMSIVFGPFYREQKENYLSGIKRTTRYIQEKREKYYEETENIFIIRYLVFCSLLVLGLTLWVIYVIYSLRSNKKSNFYDISNSYSLRMKKVLSIVANDLRSYISVCRSSYNVMSTRLKTIQKSGWIDENGMSGDDFEITEEMHNQQVGNVDFLLNEMKTISREHTEQQKAVSVDECIIRANEIVVSKYSDWSKIKYSESYSKERLFFYGNEESLTHIFVELFSNSYESIKHNFKPWLKLKAWEDRDEGMIKILVSDSGDEIPAAAKKKIFDPFFTTKGDQKFVGIGLNVAKELLRELGGTIEYLYKNDTNCFLISIPKLADEFSE